MSSIDSIYIMIFISGLLGGFGHCIGMCGPIVATYSVGLPRHSLRPHIFYNLGRIATYSFLGGIMGVTGSFASVVKSIERFQNIFLAVVGLLMVLVGLSSMDLFSFFGKRKDRNVGATSPILFAAAYLSRLIGHITTVIVETKSASAFFPAGLLLGFIPCGLLYTALIAAAGAGAASASRLEGFLHGFLLLLLFGIGTAPALFVVGGVVSLRSEQLRVRLYRAAAMMMVLAGVLYVYRAIRH